MNGRVFDPVIARFMQADPLISEPMNLQNYDRHQYCFNSPLICTDPTGYFSLKKLLKAVVVIAVAIYAPYALEMYGNFAAGTFVSAGGMVTLTGAASAGFMSGAIAGGSLKSGLQGAFSAGVFFGVGSVVGDAGLSNAGAVADAGKFAEAIALHGVAGCITSVSAGGKCGPGALSAAFSKAALPITTGMGDGIGRGIAHAVVGGIGSTLGGGKFENGAMTGAFSYLFNDITQSRESKVRLYGRYAVDVGDLACRPDCIHLSIVIEDQYSGATLIDGQPRGPLRLSLENSIFTLSTNVESGFQSKPVFQLDLAAPEGMSNRQFASALMSAAQSFEAGSVGYKFPHVPSGYMPSGHNSNSYVSGLLRAVTGSVPAVNFGPNQAPGWLNPIPAARYGR